MSKHVCQSHDELSATQNGRGGPVLRGSKNFSTLLKESISSKLEPICSSALAQG